MATRNAQLRDVHLQSLSDADLDVHLGAAVALFDNGYRVHFALQTALMMALGELAFFCRDELGWTDTETFELLTGLSPTSKDKRRSVDRHRRLTRPPYRTGARRSGRIPARSDPSGRCPGLPHHLACVVDHLPERRSARHKYWRYTLPSGDHRARVRHPGSGGNR